MDDIAEFGYASEFKVRDFVRSYLDVDEYGDGQPDFSYPVHSLYLDSDLLTIYWGTINGDKNRYKLRLRFYNDHRPHSAFGDADPKTPMEVYREPAAIALSA